VPRVKTYLHAKERGLTPESIMFADMVGTNESAKIQIKALFDNKAVFETPKPVNLIKVLLQLAAPRGIVVDFFSGSGTTAQAVMELNAEDNAKREFVLVQLPEKCPKSSEGFKAGYETIFDITKDRIIKSGEKILIENIDHPEHKDDLVCEYCEKKSKVTIPAKQSKNLDYLDIGFKVFETVEDFRVTTDEELTLSNLTMFDDDVLTEEQYKTLLTTWSLYDGSLLTTPINTIELNDYNAHYCDGRLYLIAPDFSTESLKVLLTKLDIDSDFSPHKIVFYGNNFESAKQMELNEALKSYANKKSLEIEIVARY
jgi:adenine-specific DNA-methyltransferase